jgi:glutamate/aspartate transport system substrate-binding protein
MKSVDFSNLIFVDASGFMVRVDARIQRAAELSGKRIAVIAGTTNEAALERALKQHAIAAQVVRVREAGEAVALLEAGGAEAFAGDRLKLVGAAAQARDPKAFALLPDDLSFEPYAFALPRNDTAMRATVNGALGELFRGPELDRIFARWFGTLGSPSALLGSMYLLSITPE